jgi:hypothetical protein
MPGIASFAEMALNNKGSIMVIPIFDKWFASLTTGDQEELIAHIIKEKSGLPIMEGLFSGPYGKIDHGALSGPLAGINRKICPSCHRPI